MYGTHFASILEHWTSGQNVAYMKSFGRYTINEIRYPDADVRCRLSTVRWLLITCIRDFLHFCICICMCDRIVTEQTIWTTWTKLISLSFHQIKHLAKILDVRYDIIVRTCAQSVSIHLIEDTSYRFDGGKWMATTVVDIICYGWWLSHWNVLSIWLSFVPFTFYIHMYNFRI